MTSENLERHFNTEETKTIAFQKQLADKVADLCSSIPLYSKQLSGDLRGKRSIRINLQHRLVYEVLESEKIIKILSMWSHYE